MIASSVANRLTKWTMDGLTVSADSVSEYGRVTQDLPPSVERPEPVSLWSVVRHHYTARAEARGSPLPTPGRPIE